MADPLHGGRIHETARKLGLLPESILDFSANLNPLGPPEGVLEIFRTATPELLAAYPDTEAPGLRRRLEARHGLRPAQLILGHGGAALLMLALRALAPRRVLVPVPCFREQPRAIAACGAVMVPLPMPGMALDLMALERALGGCDAVLLTNPHNPTGQCLSKALLLGLMDRHPAVSFIVDEAFGDYAPEASLLPEALERPRLVVLRSLTKCFAMPALRVGYACAEPGAVAWMEGLQEAWPCGQLDLLAAEAALDDTAYWDQSLRAFQEDAPRMKEGLEALGLEVLPSAAPFFLVRLPAPCGTAWAESLQAEGILVRTCRDWPGLDDRYLRLAVKRPEAQDRLFQALSILNSET